MSAAARGAAGWLAIQERNRRMNDKRAAAAPAQATQRPQPAPATTKRKTA